MPVQNRKGAVKLFKESDTSDLMRHRHCSQRYYMRSVLTCPVAEAIGPADCEQKGLSLTRKLILHERRETLGRELLAA